MKLEEEERRRVKERGRGLGAFSQTTTSPLRWIGSHCKAWEGVLEGPQQVMQVQKWMERPLWRGRGGGWISGAWWGSGASGCEGVGCFLGLAAGEWWCHPAGGVSVREGHQFGCQRPMS